MFLKLSNNTRLQVRLDVLDYELKNTRREEIICSIQIEVRGVDRKISWTSSEKIRLLAGRKAYKMKI